MVIDGVKDSKQLDQLIRDNELFAKAIRRLEIENYILRAALSQLSLTTYTEVVKRIKEKLKED